MQSTGRVEEIVTPLASLPLPPSLTLLPVPSPSPLLPSRYGHGENRAKRSNANYSSFAPESPVFPSCYVTSSRPYFYYESSSPVSRNNGYYLRSGLWTPFVPGTRGDGTGGKGGAGRSHRKG